MVLQHLRDIRPLASVKLHVRDEVVRQGFVPIYVKDALDSQFLVEAAIEAGCRVLEYTCRRQDARTMIPWIKREFPHVSVLGASMVDGPRAAAFLRATRPNFTTVDEMVDLGADGLVSFMGFRPETYARYGAKVLMIPGVKTYNEALGELELGADFIKFPGNSPWGAGLLSSAVSATHGLFPVLVTGGCTLEKIAEFIKSGAVLLASGFDVILKSKALDEETVTRKLLVWAVRSMLSEVRQARSLYQPRLYEAVETGADNPLSAGGWIS